MSTRTKAHRSARRTDSSRYLRLATLVLLLALLPGLPAGASVTSENAVALRKLVILGASYAQTWGTPPLPGYEVVNRGAGGEQTKAMRDRFTRDVVAVQPDAVLIWGHINNITQSDLADSTMDGVKKDAREDYLAMLDQSRAAGIEVILVTEIPLAEPTGLVNEARGLLGRLRGKQSYAERVNLHVRDLNAFVRQLASRQGTRLLDFDKIFAPDGSARQPQFAAEDRSHVTAAGYEALTKYAAAELGERR
jgi:lysophospholipase L1-like esterase